MNLRDRAMALAIESGVESHELIDTAERILKFLSATDANSAETRSIKVGGQPATASKDLNTMLNRPTIITTYPGVTDVTGTQSILDPHANIPDRPKIEGYE